MGSGRSKGGEEWGLCWCFGGGCMSPEHARGTIEVLIWQIERCSQGGVWVQEWHLGSHPWNEKNKLNFCSLGIAPLHLPLIFLIEVVPLHTSLSVILRGTGDCEGKIKSDFCKKCSCSFMPK